uniref:GSKIP domain-containing protein n=1 Tax=Plectus sambesii TaxID=2011161 RepID=A0A914UKL8_9BILA
MGMSLNEVSTRNRSYQGTNNGSLSTSRGEQSSLELEAIAAVHELSFAVQTISVSEMLPRTSELIFVNVSTVEGQPYCLELTMKGWRVTSLRQDCMNGDFRRMDLHTKYFESPYQLMDTISPGYRDLFGEKLAARLRMLAVDGEEGCMAPFGSYVPGSIFPEDMDSPERVCSPTARSSGVSFPQTAPTPIVTVRHPSGGG